MSNDVFVGVRGRDSSPQVKVVVGRMYSDLQESPRQRKSRRLVSLIVRLYVMYDILPRRSVSESDGNPSFPSSSPSPSPSPPQKRKRRKHKHKPLSSDRDRCVETFTTGLSLCHTSIQQLISSSKEAPQETQQTLLRAKEGIGQCVRG